MLKVLVVEIGLLKSFYFFSYKSRFRLAITTVNEPSFNYSNNDALFAMFDGGLNDEVATILKNKLSDILQHEFEQSTQANVYLKHTFLSLQK